MSAIKYTFKEIVFLGPNPEVFLKNLPNNVFPEIFIYCDSAEENIKQNKLLIDQYLAEAQNQGGSQTIKNHYGLLISNTGKLPLKDNSISCLVSHLELHTKDSIEESLKEISRVLVPDGCLLVNCVSENSFSEVASAFALAEAEREGGISLNSHYFPSPQNMGAMLNKYNFNLSSINVNKYMNLFDSEVKVFEYLKEIGETNALINKRDYKRKDTFIAAMAIYKSMFNLKKLKEESKENWVFYLNYEQRKYYEENKKFMDLKANGKSHSEEDIVYSLFYIMNFIGWKFHESQQQPIERGSAEFNLKDVFADTLSTEENEDIRYGVIIPKEEKDEFLNKKGLDFSSNQYEAEYKNYKKKKTEESQIKSGEDINAGNSDSDEFELIDLTESIRSKIRQKKKDAQIKEGTSQVNTHSSS
eukprot:CAMPEP_0170521978 /NCGR_PEP_ID=MMETSP0209-20121228/7414_1 /TAXON_ID=665100 ORGANISM="Litonotus pictus, Strain P1" /NCGR_SAMPLE_ID=MMETSP0209 /ASSEMBLY_ACC=CAM_ASM_000301 /LENGTH=415 /DNA_ID=CAMNT_0010809223 /DNA_START=161 /DNA_END=1405 /DNA_ORIENTATION=+